MQELVLRPTSWFITMASMQALQAIQQLAFFCLECGASLESTADRAGERCPACAQPNTRPTGAPSLSTPTASELPPTEPKQRRKRRPNWAYKCQRDDVVELFTIFMTIFNVDMSNHPFDDPDFFRWSQIKYLDIVERYFDAGTPYGTAQTGMIKWIEEKWMNEARQPNAI
jgi:hypothetical protein